MNTISLCLIAPEFLPVWGGTGSYVVELLKYLPKEVEVHVVTLRRQTPDASKNVSIENDPKTVLNREINIHYISDAKETFFYNLGFQFACFKRIPKLHKEFKFDVLHSQFGHMSDILIQLVRKIRVPNVATVHGTIALLNEVSSKISFYFSELEWSEKQVRMFYPQLRALEILYSKYVSQFIAVSKITKERILKDLSIDPQRVCTVYNGVDPHLFKAPSKEDTKKRYSEPTVVYMGRIMAKKGITVLIRAMPKILKEKPNLRFVFIGGGNILFYRDVIRRMKIPEKNFTFLGHLGYFERQEFLRRATVFVNPSFFELCSLSILEAMSSGTSVVAGDVGGNPEIISSGKDGLLFSPSDHDELADDIITLVNDENLGKEMGKQARRTVERSFTSERCAKETCEIYRQMIQ
jgi:glycosyltransferase involved in cell wall biosynthesis